MARTRIGGPVSMLVAAALTLSACGGGGDDTESGADDRSGSGNTTQPSDVPDGDTEAPESNTGDTGDDAATASGGPVTGALVSLLDIGFGLYSIDRMSGDPTTYELEGVEYVDRSANPIVTGDRAYMVTTTTLEDQSYASEYALASMDLFTGAITPLTVLGNDRDTDDDQEPFSYELLTASSDGVWVLQIEFSTGERTVRGFDPTGAPIAEFVGPIREIVTEEGNECTDETSGLITLADGSLITLVRGWPATVDPTTGMVESTVNSCDYGMEPTLADQIDPASIGDYSITESGAAIADEDVEGILQGIKPSAQDLTGVVEHDGSLWWITIAQTQSSTAETAVTIGGLVQFDLATQTVTKIWPLGDALGNYLADEGDGMVRVETIGDYQIWSFDGALWVMDQRDDAPLRRIDPATGTITEIAIEKGAGIDLTDATFVNTDPEGLWLDVVRKEITSAEGEGLSTMGTHYLERIDPNTNEVAISVSVAELLAVGG